MGRQMRKTYVNDLAISIRLLPKSSTPLGALAQQFDAPPPVFIPMVGPQKGAIVHPALVSDTVERRAHALHIVASRLNILAV